MFILLQAQYIGPFDVCNAGHAARKEIDLDTTGRRPIINLVTWLALPNGLSTCIGDQVVDVRH